MKSCLKDAVNSILMQSYISSCLSFPLPLSVVQSTMTDRQTDRQTDRLTDKIDKQGRSVRFYDHTDSLAVIQTQRRTAAYWTDEFTHMPTGIIVIWIKPLPLPSPPAAGVDRDTIYTYFLLGNVTPPFPFSFFLLLFLFQFLPPTLLPYYFVFLIHPLEESLQC